MGRGWTSSEAVFYFGELALVDGIRPNSDGFVLVGGNRFRVIGKKGAVGPAGMTVSKFGVAWWVVRAMAA